MQRSEFWKETEKGFHYDNRAEDAFIYRFIYLFCYCWSCYYRGARCSSVVRAFARGAMGRRIDPSWGGPIELFLVPASTPRLV